MTERTRPANRRAAVAFEFAHCNLRYRAHVGFFPDGRPSELFLDSSKQNSALDAFAADAAILISLLLQHGATVVEIGHALRRAPSGAPASLICAAVDELAQLRAVS
jgi:hypothetical protein